jgi:DNA polymerase (family 10)
MHKIQEVPAEFIRALEQCLLTKLKSVNVSDSSAGTITKYIKQHPIIMVGSYRREDPPFNDIDILSVVDINLIIEAINKCSQLLNVVSIMAHGIERSTLIVNPAKQTDIFYQIDIFYTPADELYFALLHHTGSKLYNIRVRASAKKQGYLLNQHGLFKDGKNKINVKFNSEGEILKYLGLTVREPKDRSDE